MKIDANHLSGPCSCGGEHLLATQICVIQEGALFHLEEILSSIPVVGKRCAVYDENTYRAIPNSIHPRAEQEIILSPSGLHADENSTASVLARLEPDIQVMLAIGGGTVHDITRYCSTERGIPFISIPTAASCDGFCSNVAAMTWPGYKKTIPCQAPLLVVADLDVISAAPWRLTASGIGDMLGKFIALTDWRISHLLTGEKLCPVIYQIMEDAVDSIWTRCRDLRSGGSAAYEAVVYGLLMSGLAMQMIGTSRPASGAEHHVSHFIEVEPAALRTHSSALHGEKVGVGTLLIAQEYQRLSQIENIASLALPYAPVSDERLMEVFGPRLFSACREENLHDCLAQVTPERLIQQWPQIRQIIAKIPPAAQIHQFLTDLKASASLSDLGVPEAALELILEASPLIRNRLTFMRVRRMIRH